MNDIQKIAKDNINFFSDINKHLELIDESVDYKKIIYNQAPQKGTKLFLELSVEEPILAYYLFNWLNNKNNEPILLFGSKLESIHFGNISKEELKSNLIEYIKTL